VSTKSTLHIPPHRKWCLEEECLDETTLFKATNPHVELHTNDFGAHFTIVLPDDAIEALVSLHARGELPYQRAPRSQ
jgi:hypothetical protein